MIIIIKLCFCEQSCNMERDRRPLHHIGMEMVTKLIEPHTPLVRCFQKTQTHRIPNLVREAFGKQHVSFPKQALLMGSSRWCIAGALTPNSLQPSRARLPFAGIFMIWWHLLPKAFRDWRLGDESNREIVSFRFVACAWSGCPVECDPKSWDRPFPSSLLPSRAFPFPFPHPQTSYPTLVGLIGSDI